MPETLSSEQGTKILLGLIGSDQLRIYSALVTAAERSGIRLAMGGGLAVSAYSGSPRNTKDMDLYVVPADHERLLELMGEQGYAEYEEVPYDPTWSYRGTRDGYVVDILWRMLNGRTSVDEVWTSRGWRLTLGETVFPLIPPEELVWSKLYILRRDRTDWPDILNILYAQGAGMDWRRLLVNLDGDRPVLAGVMALFRWMCPGRAGNFPEWIWNDLGLAAGNEDGPEADRARIGLMSAQDWFIPEVRQ